MVFRKSLWVAGVVGALTTGVQAAVDLKIDFGREGQAASTIAAGYDEYATDRLNPPAPGPYVRTIDGHNITLTGREDAYTGFSDPRFRSDNRSAAVVPIGENVQLFQDVVRIQGDVSGVDVTNVSQQQPVIMFTIDNLAPNTPYAIEIGGFDGGSTVATYTYIVQPTVGSGTTGASTTYGFTIGPAGSIFTSNDPSANSLWTGSTVFTSNANGVLSFESVLDLANSVGSDSLTFVSMLTVQTVPEPASLGLLAIGGLMMLARRRA